MLNRISYLPCIVAILIAVSACSIAQSDAVAGQQQSTPGTQRSEVNQKIPTTPPPAEEAPKLLIGPGDEMDITVYGVPDLSRHTRVTSDGKIDMPLLGYCPIAGMTVEDAQALLEKRLVEGNFLKNPHVTIEVKEFTNQAVSVIGAVSKPGLYPVHGSRTLLDVLLMAGGLDQKAGNTVTITHREHPQDPVTVKINSDLQPAEGAVAVVPGDVVTVPKGHIVYMLGGVNQPGGYVILDQDTTLLGVFARAAGPARGASLNKTKLIRKSSGGMQEIHVPLVDIMRGKTADLTLQPEDIIYIPTSEHSGMRTILQAVQYAAIFRP